MKSELNYLTAMSMNSLSQSGSLAAKVKIADQKMEKAAKEFEAVFVSEMMKPMFEGIKTDGTFGGGQAEEIFRSIMIQEYGKMISTTGRVGISDKVKEAMIEMQGTQPSTLKTSHTEG